MSLMLLRVTFSPRDKKLKVNQCACETRCPKKKATLLYGVYLSNLTDPKLSMRHNRRARNNPPHVSCVIEVFGLYNETFYASLLSTSCVNLMSDEMIQFFNHHPIVNQFLSIRDFYGTLIQLDNWQLVSIRFSKSKSL